MYILCCASKAFVYRLVRPLLLVHISPGTTHLSAVTIINTCTIDSPSEAPSDASFLYWLHVSTVYYIYVLNVLPFCTHVHADLGGTTVLTFEAGDYPIGFEKELPLTFPIVSGPQNYFTKVALDPITEGVTAGGMIHILNKHQQVFPEANITVIEDGELLHK